MNGPTKKETRDLIIKLEKKSKKAGKAFWKDIAKRLAKPSRGRASVNVYKLEAIAKKNNNKVLVVPGKILATGNIETKIVVAGLDCSEKARKKIETAKGKVMSIEELLESKEKESNMVIVK